ncbi:MAG: L,D-transpeptidase family protein [Syntrophales bacterium]|nr:L,D-transpeptidase family protein [Syntrophales bacterium]
MSTGFAVFVDKKQQKLYVFQRLSNGYDKVFESPCSTGKVQGAKMVEGDAKTPNGIFFATRFATMPDTNSTYGSMVFYLDYPNLLDRRAGRNGDNIWIHGTNKLLQPNQSNGCVALRNQDIEYLSRFIYLGKTPIVIEEAIKWVDQKDRRAEAEELERIAKVWTRSMIDGDWKTFNSLYLQEGLEPSSQRVALYRKATLLKTPSWHFDVMPRDITICKLGYTAVVMFSQVLTLKATDNFQGGYVKLFLERYSNGWFIVEHVRPLPVPKKEPAVQARAEAGRKPEAAVGDGGKKPEREVVQLVERWASNWEKGRMDRYGACYAPSFRSQGKDLRTWVAYKQELSKRYRDIRVRADNIRVSVNGDRATATFRQHYSASNLKSSGAKRLDLIRVNGEWKIARESISR